MKNFKDTNLNFFFLNANFLGLYIKNLLKINFFQKTPKFYEFIKKFFQKNVNFLRILKKIFKKM
ncbi:MAG: hypothetical protein B6I24_06830 [Bacteroidetes bacterium 4572_128]|nr:MAG: hypothetical protein B6I24_06830 [Bacteroidetes bacterium 4572_128]